MEVEEREKEGGNENKKENRKDRRKTGKGIIILRVKSPSKMNIGGEDVKKKGGEGNTTFQKHERWFFLFFLYSLPKKYNLTGTFVFPPDTCKKMEGGGFISFELWRSCRDLSITRTPLPRKLNCHPPHPLFYTTCTHLVTLS